MRDAESCAHREEHERGNQGGETVVVDGGAEHGRLSSSALMQKHLEPAAKDEAIRDLLVKRRSHKQRFLRLAVTDPRRCFICNTPTV
jgi:hypothetical protein